MASLTVLGDGTSVSVKMMVWRDDQGREDGAVGGVGSGVRQVAQGDDPDLAAGP
jgi:hypothetical protein